MITIKASYNLIKNSQNQTTQINYVYVASCSVVKNSERLSFQTTVEDSYILQQPKIVEKKDIFMYAMQVLHRHLNTIFETLSTQSEQQFTNYSLILTE